MNVSLQILGTTSFVLSNFTNTSQFLPENNGLNANFDYTNNVAGFSKGFNELFVRKLVLYDSLNNYIGFKSLILSFTNRHPPCTATIFMM